MYVNQFVYAQSDNCQHRECARLSILGPAGLAPSRHIDATYEGGVSEFGMARYSPQSFRADVTFTDVPVTIDT